LQSALACRRSTAALARGTAGPQGSASGHVSRDQSGALDPIRPPRPGSGDLAHLRGRYPRRRTLSQSSEHLTHRSWCRQSDARAARVRRDEPSPAGTAIPPRTSRSSRGRRPFTKSGRTALLFLARATSSRIIAVIDLSDFASVLLPVLWEQIRRLRPTRTLIRKHTRNPQRHLPSGLRHRCAMSVPPR